MTTNNPLFSNQHQPYNPQFTQMLQQPGAQQFIAQMLQQNPGKSPRDLAYQLAQQKGIPTDRITQMAQRLGL